MSKTLRILSIVFSLLPAVYIAGVSFVHPSNTALLDKTLHSPVHTGLWIVFLAGSLTAFITGIRQKARLVWTHLALVILGVAVMATLATSRETYVELREGEDIELAAVAGKLGINEVPPLKISLLRFDKITLTNKKRPTLWYISEVEISYSNHTDTNRVEVNHPLRVAGMKWIQSDWSLFPRQFRFRFRGFDFDLENYRGEALRLDEERLFVFSPQEFRRRTDGTAQVEYEYRVFHPDKGTLEKGYFTSQSVPGWLWEEYGFAIGSEEWIPVSVFLVTYKPLLPLAAVTAVLFLLVLGWELTRMNRKGDSHAGN